MNSATIEKYLPWMIGAGAVIGGIILFRSGAGVTDGIAYNVIPPNDVSAQQQAALQMRAANLQAKATGFQAIVQTYNNELAVNAELQARRDQQRQELAVVTANNQMQQYAINAQQSTARHNSNNQTFASIVGTVATLAILACYRTTEMAAEKRAVYYHGAVA